MANDYGPGAALTVAVLIGIMYEQGGALRLLASLIILAVLITPVNGKSLLVQLLDYLNTQLKSELKKGY